MEYIKFQEYCKMKLNEVTPQTNMAGGQQAQNAAEVNKIIQGIETGRLSGDEAKREIDKLKAQQAKQQAINMRNKMLSKQAAQATTGMSNMKKK